MTESPHPVRFPGESDEYRARRNELLKAEMELRDRLEAVAARRRALPRGGKLKEEYVFEEVGTSKKVSFAELFAAGKTSLIVYNFMYGPKMEKPCPMCTSILDGLNGQAHHVGQRTNLAVVAKSPPDRIRAFAESRGWKRLRLLSSAGTSYNADYQGETAEGQQMPACNVFTKTPEGIFHTYATELLFTPPKGGQARHVDLLWPLWNLLDLTPEGRGKDWLPALEY